jgi:8-oxo-dGTP diphosphatase
MMTDFSAAAVVFRANNKYLILKRGPTANWYPNYWNLPGGCPESGETPAKTAVRESFEETGIYPPYLILLSKARVDGAVYFYGCNLPKIPSITPDPNENSEHCWVTIEELDNYEFVPGVREAILIFAQK